MNYTKIQFLMSQAKAAGEQTILPTGVHNKITMNRGQSLIRLISIHFIGF